MAPEHVRTRTREGPVLFPKETLQAQIQELRVARSPVPGDFEGRTFDGGRPWTELHQILNPNRTEHGAVDVESAQYRDHVQGFVQLLRQGHGFLLETSLHCNVGGNTATEALFQRSYDPFMKIYRVVITEGAFGYLDVYEGNFDDNGCLLLSNEGLATPLSSAGSTFCAHYRLELDAPGPGRGYTIFGSFSMNGGDSWSDGLELRFDPAESGH